jgi:hypothetical protein
VVRGAGKEKAMNHYKPENEQWLRSLTYEWAEWHYHMGSVSQDDWEWYCDLWRNSAPRFSSLAEAYEREDHPEGWRRDKA